jgi:hypothetical protein
MTDTALPLGVYAQASCQQPVVDGGGGGVPSDPVHAIYNSITTTTTTSPVTVHQCVQSGDADDDGGIHLLVFRVHETDLLTGVLDILSDQHQPLHTPNGGAAGGGVQCHAKMYGMLVQLYATVELHIVRARGGSTFHFTGHGIGGAIAALFVLLAITKRSPAMDRITHLVTFGQPRFCNWQGRRRLIGRMREGKLCYTRVVNECDALACLPPMAFGYAHAGGVVTLTATGIATPTYARNWYNWILGAYTTLASEAPLHFIVCHLPGAYLKRTAAIGRIPDQMTTAITNDIRDGSVRRVFYSNSVRCVTGAGVCALVYGGYMGGYLAWLYPA